MKKFVGLALAAVCALTFSAFSFTGCDEEGDTSDGDNGQSGQEVSKVSDVVTEDVWKAAMSAENALNVRMYCDLVATTTYTTNDGESGTRGGSSVMDAKTALTKIDSSSSMVGGNVTGNTYLYGDESNESDGITYTASSIVYGTCTADLITYVEKTNQYTGDVDWSGKQSEASNFESTSDMAYYYIINYMCMYADSFADFEFTDGVYKYTSAEDYDLSIKINNGYLTSIHVVSSYTEENGSTYKTYSYVATWDITFSDYGTTTVEIPEEYTYAYYPANNAN